MNRDEYLARPLIEQVTYDIGEECIRVFCPHTLFLDVHRCKTISLSEVEQSFRELKSAVQNSNGVVRLKGVTKFLPLVRSLYPAYFDSCLAIDEAFSELVGMVRQIEIDGIHFGCCDDELLNSALEKQNIIYRQHYRNTDFSRFSDCYHKVEHMLRDKPWESDDEIIEYIIPLA